VIPEGPLGPVRAVAAMWPAWVGYVATFVILGGYWIGQHAQFQLIRRADHGLLWGTIVFLLFVAALPFSASLVGHHLWAPGAVSVYCAHLVAIGVSHYGVWRHATAGHLLVDARMPNATVRRHVALALAAPVAYALAIPLAFVNTLAALAVCIVVPVVYVLVPHALAAERPRGRRRTP
jgi:uncharacterized membrane protein